MNIILFGPPGSGKGTQADKISKEFNLHKISTGDLLREEIKKKSSLGNKIKDLVDKGTFVSDEIINNLIESIFLNKSYNNNFIFDGYPRTLNQAINFESILKKFDKKISIVLSLIVSEENLIKRIIGRQICSSCGLIFNEFFNSPNNKSHGCDPKFLKKRSDDNESTIKSRLANYLKLTQPIVKFYSDKKLLRKINGEGEISSIYKQIQAIITSVKAWLYTMYLLNTFTGIVLIKIWLE